MTSPEGNQYRYLKQSFHAKVFYFVNHAQMRAYTEIHCLRKCMVSTPEVHSESCVKYL